MSVFSAYWIRSPNNVTTAKTSYKGETRNFMWGVSSIYLQTGCDRPLSAIMLKRHNGFVGEELT